jgi:hypothetical protein
MKTHVPFLTGLVNLKFAQCLIQMFVLAPPSMHAAIWHLFMKICMPFLVKTTWSQLPAALTSLCTPNSIRTPTVVAAPAGISKQGLSGAARTAWLLERLYNVANTVTAVLVEWLII